MHPGTHSATRPDHPAVVEAETGNVLSYRELDAAIERLSRYLHRAGIGQGDVVAILAENSPRYLVAAWAAQRTGLYYTAMSTRLTPDETAYILRDSGAKAVLVSQGVAAIAQEARNLVPQIATWLSIDGEITGFDSFDQHVTPIDLSGGEGPAHVEGSDLLYSSGTTGVPKGVKRKLPLVPMEESTDPLASLAQLAFGFDQDTIYLSPAPLYHAAPLRFCIATQRIGGTVVVMKHFDPVGYLDAIARFRATHTQVVPTMFVRLLKLPEESRRSADVSSLKFCIHAAAPCPVTVKQAMLDWWGPIVHEYYAGTEGNGFVYASPQDWLAHPGTVGRSLTGPVHILDDDGHELSAGERGTVYFEQGGFEYHNDPEKTAAARTAQGWTTLGDVGYLDEEGFLFLTDRKAYMIISGGVNIYPQEAENVLTMHPAVADVAVFGIPHEEMGEEVKAVVQPVEGVVPGPDLERELIAYCRDRLAHYKCPKSVDFDAELPRHPTGKLYKRLVRDRYWPEQETLVS
ncbi:MAG TPA: acyl-CoA synthetase [Acidimicrobiales bacterium]|nr:acyl-CoA synthetase [Acidimicrobiales bacterium]